MGPSAGACFRSEVLLACCSTILQLTDSGADELRKLLQVVHIDAQEEEIIDEKPVKVELTRKSKRLSATSKSKAPAPRNASNSTASKAGVN